MIWMPEQGADVAVIGGGITGLTAALRLSEYGASVEVLDAGLNVGSNANVGSLHVQLQSRFLRLFPDQAPNVEASLLAYLAAVREWRRLDRRLGGRIGPERWIDACRMCRPIRLSWGIICQSSPKYDWRLITNIYQIFCLPLLNFN